MPADPAGLPRAEPPVKRLEVAVGVVMHRDGRVLLGQRVAGKPYAGWWEFPGGKIEAGETVAQALARELHEELGLQVGASHPWLVREFVYPHAHVRLHFRRLFGAWDDFHGEPQSREGQAFAWLDIDQPARAPLLPASEPVFGWLRLPTVLRVEGARVRGEADGGPAGPGAVVRLAEGMLLEPAALRALTERPASGLCGARCESAADLALAADRELDFVVARTIDPGTALPLYLDDPTLSPEQARRGLRAAVAAGAHGIVLNVSA